MPWARGTNTLVVCCVYGPKFRAWLDAPITQRLGRCDNPDVKLAHDLKGSETSDSPQVCGSMSSRWNLCKASSAASAGASVRM